MRAQSAMARVPYPTRQRDSARPGQAISHKRHAMPAEVGELCGRLSLNPHRRFVVKLLA